MEAFVAAFSEGDGGAFFKSNYSGFVSKKTRLVADDFDYSDIADICDTFWKEFMQREELAIEEVFS